MDTRSASCSSFLNQKATGHFASSVALPQLLMLSRGSIFYFAIKLAPWKPLFPLKVSAVLCIISYFYLFTVFYLNVDISVLTSVHVNCNTC